jgi:hypothetical protein
MSKHREQLAAIYNDFNARRIDRVLSQLCPDVDWSNGMEGGRVSGREAVRDYWTRQFTMLNPRVDPVGFKDESPDSITVNVHQVVHDPAGALIVDQMVDHVYYFRDELIERMEIREHAGPQ